MQDFQNLRLLENTLNKAALRKYLEFEEQHNSRLKCIKRLRIFLKIKVGKRVRIRIDGRVINDYKNVVETRMSELLKKVVVVLDENTETKYLDQLEFENENDNLANNNEDEKLITDDLRSELTDSEKIDNRKKSDIKRMFDNTKLDEKNVTLILENDENVYEWHNNGEKLDGFELVCDQMPRSIKILMEFDNSKDLVRLSDSLRKILLTDTITKTNATIEFWKYLRTHKAINEEGIIVRNDQLKDIFAKDVHINDLFQELDKHFLPLEILAFKVPVCDYERIFDVKLERDDLNDFPVIYKNKNVNLLERKIQYTLEYIDRSKDKLEVLGRFSNDPNYFVKHHITVECKDLDFLGISSKGIFTDPKILESIYEMLKK